MLLAAWIGLRIIPGLAAPPADAGYDLRLLMLLVVPWVLGFAAVTVFIHRRMRAGTTAFTSKVAVQSSALFLVGGVVFLLAIVALGLVPLLLN